MTRTRLILFSALIGSALVAGAFADDWNTTAKNSLRDGLSADLGPDTANLLWSGGRYSMIAWPPFIEGQRVFTIRQMDWPGEVSVDALVVAIDIDSGMEVWAKSVPYFPGDWVPWIGAVNDGKVYVSRSGYDTTTPAPLYAYSAKDGHIIWTSEAEIDARGTDGMVFAPNGDPVIGSFSDIWRISAVDGRTVWHAERMCSIAGSCGGAIHGDAFYVADTGWSGHYISRYDLATGVRQYDGPEMPGFLLQNTPFCGPDGTIYISRTQNNPSVDYFYAFEDTGSAITQKWSIPAAWTPCSEFGIGPDGSIYMLKPGYEFVRLDPADGSELSSAGYLATPDYFMPRIAIDAAGRVYLSNGSWEAGRLYSFDADLTPRWDTAVMQIHTGGPALGAGGTLVVCGMGTDIRAYRTPRGDLNCDGELNAFDIDPFVLALTDPASYAGMYPACDEMYADINADGVVNAFDIDPFVALLTGG
jgi:outer membrane protein assembly factor BamB